MEETTDEYAGNPNWAGDDWWLKRNLQGNH